MSSPSANAIHAVRCILREAGNPLVVVITMIVLRFGRPNARAHVRLALRSARVERKILRAARGLKAVASVATASTRNGPSRCGQGLLVDSITAPGAADVEYLATCPPDEAPPVPIAVLSGNAGSPPSRSSAFVRRAEDCSLCLSSCEPYR